MRRRVEAIAAVCSQCRVALGGCRIRQGPAIKGGVLDRGTDSVRSWTDLTPQTGECGTKSRPPGTVSQPERAKSARPETGSPGSRMDPAPADSVHPQDGLVPVVVAGRVEAGLPEERAATPAERAASSSGIEKFGDEAVKRARASTRAYAGDFDYEMQMAGTMPTLETAEHLSHRAAGRTCALRIIRTNSRPISVA